jgi:alkylation response protein AidB-like acyl-CoA dehydrogenase
MLPMVKRPPRHPINGGSQMMTMLELTTRLDPPPRRGRRAGPSRELDAGLRQAIQDSAASGDQTGDLVGSHDRMLAEGLFHILVPREFGGAGGSVVDWFDTALAVAEVDAAAGWIMAQGAVQNAWIAVSGQPRFATEYFRVRRTIATSSAGKATAERRGDRFLVRNAHWSYVSGCQGAALVGGMVRTTTADGAPETRMILVPADAATITPSWDTLGLRGTGSHDIELGDEITVPVSHTFTWPTLTITRPGPLATAIVHTAWLISLSAAAVNLGAARRAIREATASAEHKMHRFDTVPVIQQSPFLRGIAELHGQVDLATAGLRALLDELWDHALDGEEPAAEQRARLRLAAAAAIHTGADVVRATQLLTGADALHRAHPLERLGRDTQMLLNHVAISPSTREQLATVLLGTYQGPPALI